MAAIKSISKIPYCGQIYIEGYKNTETGEIINYWGVTNSFCEDFGNPGYFRAKWTGNVRRGTTITDCRYEEY